MNFEYNESQQLLADSVTRFVADRYDLARRNDLIAKDPGFSADNWSQFAELGWLALPFSEADGGFDGTAVDLIILFEQFGKGLVVEPYLASVVLGGGIIKRAANAAQRNALLPGVLDGSHQLALGYVERQARFDLHDVTTTATASDGGFSISGAKSIVLNGATANHIVISARTSGGQIDTSGMSLFLIPADAEGVALDNYPTVDGMRASEVTLTNVQVGADALLGELGGGHDILQKAIYDGILAVSAEAVGAMEVLYTDTVAYTQEREQFGHPLSEFQVLQHRMVDMFVEYELTKSLLYRAAMEIAADAPTAARTVHALKARLGKAATFVAQNAVQLHGGMGMTEELRIGHYFKRLTAIDLLFGDGDYHMQQFVSDAA